MSEEPQPPASGIRRALQKGRPADSPGTSARIVLDQHLGLYLVLSLATGLTCGALGAFVNSLNVESPPFLDSTVGLYVIPPVLFGWLAARSVPASAAGSTVYLATVLGHLAMTASSADDQNLLEYRAWLFMGLTLGAILGHLGWRIRSHAIGVRAFAAGFPLGLMALFLWMSMQAQTEAEGRILHPAAIVLEGILALIVLVLCRGWAAKGAALLCAIALVIPLVFALIPAFLLVWYASGDY